MHNENALKFSYMRIGIAEGSRQFQDLKSYALTVELRAGVTMSSEKCIQG